MISMVEKTILAVSLLAFCSTLSAPAYSEDCLDVNAEKLEGDLKEAPDNLHYESWMKEGTNENQGIYYFGRCIKNNTDHKDLWTHWKGILGDGWIPKSDSKMRSVGRNSERYDDKTKELWFGNNRDNLEAALTRCWQDEKPCETPGSTAEDTSGTTVTRGEVEDSTRDEEASDAESEFDALKRIIEANSSAVISDYGEVFVPLYDQDGNQIYDRNESRQLARIIHGGLDFGVAGMA